MSQSSINLHQGHATPKNIILRALPIAAAAAITTIWLYEFHATPTTIVLGDPTVIRGGGPAFPTQYEGFRVRKSGSTIDLCMVDVADAPTGMGGQVRVRRTADTLALYLVETSDLDASPVRINTTVGIKAVRLKT